ncbi:MAG: phosphoglycerate kinase [Actinomycetota bacterium]
MNLRTLDGLEVAGKRVLLRSDLNVPMSAGEISDDFRIRSSFATLRELLDRGALQVVIAAHLGRPKGEPNLKYSLAPVAVRLGELLGTTVPLAPLPPGAVPNVPVVLLENVRFNPGETKNDPEFARALASLADVYVDDAFGAVHRAHASVAAVAELLPSAAGRLLQREIEVLGRVLENPEHPLVAVLGGAKVSDKLLVIENLLRVADRLVIGGAMCFTFFRAMGYSTGTSLVEEDRIQDCARLLEQSADRILLPTDVVVAEKMEAGQATRVVGADAIPAGFAGYDIGPSSIAAYADAVAGARTVLWNGPMGVFEIEEFAEGTKGLARAVAATTAQTVVGGGDSIAALEQFGLLGSVDHASTGGGAMLEFLEGKELPGLVPLRIA